MLPVLQMDALYLITIRSDVPIDDIAENSKPCLAVSLSWWWCLYHESLNTRSWFRLHTRKICSWKIVTIPQWDDRITASIGWDPPNFWIPSDRTFLAYLWQSLVGLKWGPRGVVLMQWLRAPWRGGMNPPTTSHAKSKRDKGNSMICRAMLASGLPFPPAIIRLRIARIKPLHSGWTEPQPMWRDIECDAMWMVPHPKQNSPGSRMRQGGSGASWRGCWSRGRPASRSHSPFGSIPRYSLLPIVTVLGHQDTRFGRFLARSGSYLSLGRAGQVIYIEPSSIVCVSIHFRLSNGIGVLHNPHRTIANGIY